MPCLPGEFRRRQTFESLVRATLFVLNAPSFDLRPGFVNRLEPMNVQAFISKRSIERLDAARAHAISSRYRVVQPPSTGIAAPVTKDAPGEASHRIAEEISGARPTRLRGCIARNCAA